MTLFFGLFLKFRIFLKVFFVNPPPPIVSEKKPTIPAFGLEGGGNYLKKCFPFWYNVGLSITEEKIADALKGCGPECEKGKIKEGNVKAKGKRG
jgi:hypothetical protein